MKTERWFIVGLHLYMFPPEPKIGDFEALHNWKPQKMGVWATLKFRQHAGIWCYKTSDIEEYKGFKIMNLLKRLKFIG